MSERHYTFTKEKESGLFFGLKWSSVGVFLALSTLVSCSFFLDTKQRYNNVVGERRAPILNPKIYDPNRTVSATQGTVSGGDPTMDLGARAAAQPQTNTPYDQFDAQQNASAPLPAAPTMAPMQDRLPAQPEYVAEEGGFFEGIMDVESWFDDSEPEIAPMSAPRRRPVENMTLAAPSLAEVPQVSVQNLQSERDMLQAEMQNMQQQRQNVEQQRAALDQSIANETFALDPLPEMAAPAPQPVLASAPAIQPAPVYQPVPVPAPVMQKSTHRILPPPPPAASFAKVGVAPPVVEPPVVRNAPPQNLAQMEAQMQQAYTPVPIAVQPIPMAPDVYAPPQFDSAQAPVRLTPPSDPYGEGFMPSSRYVSRRAMRQQRRY